MVQGQSHIKSQKIAHKLQQPHAISHTQQLRASLEIEDLSDAVEEAPDAPAVTDITTEEERGPNDLSFRDNSEPESDFSWQERVQDIRHFIMPTPPRAQWRVMLDDFGNITVCRVGGDEKITEASTRREVILKFAAEFQKSYLENEEIDKLIPFSAQDLEQKIIEKCQIPDVIKAYKGRKSRVTSDLRDQYFYAPRGTLHALRFLVQEDVCGVALSCVYHALAEITDKEKREYGHQSLLKDEEIAAELCRRFKKEMFTAKQVARWREKENEWSSMRIYLPNRDGRSKVYGKS
jgi:hypothetical protein